MLVLGLLAILGLLFAGLMAAGVLGFFAYQKRGRRVRPAKVVNCRVADLRDGVCRVKGRLVAREELLKAPLTGKPCVYYRFRVDQAYEVRSWTTTYGAETSSRRDAWQQLIEDARRVAVKLEDDTGKAYLDLEEAEIDSVARSEEGIFDTSKEAGLKFDLMLQKRYGESTLADRRRISAAYSSRSSRHTQGREMPRAKALEEIIENKVAVIVVGEVETREGGPPRFRPVDYPLIVTTKPRRAVLPTPTSPATKLWIAAGIVLGATLLLAFGATILLCLSLSTPLRAGPPRPPIVVPARNR